MKKKKLTNWVGSGKLERRAHEEASAVVVVVVFFGVEGGNVVNRDLIKKRIVFACDFEKREIIRIHFSLSLSLSLSLCIP